jgi:hypothetical protein
MFATKDKIICGFILLMFCTCTDPYRQSPKSSPVAVDAGINTHHKDFLDSVQAKMKFTFSRVTQYTSLDSSFYKEHVRFLGDTVWYRTGSHPFAIIHYSIGKINKKLLLIFNRSGECTASLIVGMNGDVDGGFDSVILDYRIIDATSFSTTETWTYRGATTNEKVTITKQFYHVNKKGNILAQNNIIHSYTRPKALAARVQK